MWLNLKIRSVDEVPTDLIYIYTAAVVEVEKKCEEKLYNNFSRPISSQIVARLFER